MKEMMPSSGLRTFQRDFMLHGMISRNFVLLLETVLRKEVVVVESEVPAVGVPILGGRGALRLPLLIWTCRMGISYKC